MKSFFFITKSESRIEAESEEEAWEQFYDQVEGQIQKTAMNWIEDHTKVVEQKIKNK